MLQKFSVAFLPFFSPSSMNLYASDLSVPEDLGRTLKELTREILRHQPANIYQFASEYFAEQAVTRRVDLTKRMTEQQFCDDLTRRLAALAEERTVTLPELHAVLSDAAYDLTPVQRALLLSTFSPNAQGRVVFKSRVADAAADIYSHSYPPGPTFTPRLLAHGMLPEEFLEVLDHVFLSTAEGSDRSAPVTPSLTRAMFTAALRHPDLGLGPAEVRLLSTSIIDAQFEPSLPGTDDVSFLPLAQRVFDVLEPALAVGLDGPYRMSVQDVASGFADVCAHLDADAAGTLPLAGLRQTIIGLGYGVTRLQAAVHLALTSGTTLAADATAPYKRVVASLPTLFAALRREERALALQSTELPATVLDRDPDELAAVVLLALAPKPEADADVDAVAVGDSATGAPGLSLDPATVLAESVAIKRLSTAATTGLRLDEAEAAAIVAATALPEGGVVVAHLAAAAFDVLVSYQRELAIRAEMGLL
jgi:hypothetical protein